MTANPPRAYLDACVLLSFVNDAPGRADVVQSLLEDAEDGKVHLLTSNLSIAEVAYIASDQEPRDGTDEEATIDELWTPNSPVKLAEFSRPIAHRARSIIRKARENETARVRSADAVHLATAEINECDRFYTYERESIRKGWDALIQADVSEPYVDAPRLPSADY